MKNNIYYQVTTLVLQAQVIHNQNLQLLRQLRLVIQYFELKNGLKVMVVENHKPTPSSL
jgi:hypothetical protein